MTGNAIRIGTAALALVSMLALAGARAPDRAEPAITGSAEQAVLAAGVVETFARQGLGEAGVVAVRFDADEPWCSTRFAGVIHAPEGSTVVVCAGVRRIRHVLLHEFAHAWAHHHLDDATIAAFLDLRGLTTWAGEDLPVHLSGSEQAAEVITWGLEGDPGPVVRLPDRTCGSLDTAFRLLTGQAPATPLEGCDPAF